MVTLEMNIILFKSTILQLESKTFVLYVLKSQKENTLKEPRPNEIYPCNVSMVQHMQIKKWDTQHQQLKANNHKINSIDSGKAFDILHQYFMIKNLKKIWV